MSAIALARQDCRAAGAAGLVPVPRPLPAWFRWVAVVLVTLLCLSARGQFVTYDPATGLVRIPTVFVGEETYADVTLQWVGGSPAPTFRLTGATLSTSTTPALATYDPVTSMLTLPQVAVGAQAYRASLRNAGDYAFTLESVELLPPTVTLDPPAPGANRLSGRAFNADPARMRIVIYVLTNQWYVQPFANAPFTTISPAGTWTNSTHPWQRIAVLLVDPSTYVPAPTRITNPVLDPGVIAAAEYPVVGPSSLEFSGHRWGIKVSADRFDPGPNHWTNHPSVVQVAPDGLHLRIVQVDGRWQSAEVHLLESLGYGNYRVCVGSRIDRLDRHTVAAPLFLYAAPNQELDHEFSGAGGLVGGGFNAQFVVQPYNTPGNIVRYTQPEVAQFTSEIDWRASGVGFRTWRGCAATPAPGDIIRQWTYRGPDNLRPGAEERVRINLWLLQGRAPASGSGDTLIIRSFSFRP